MFKIENWGSDTSNIKNSLGGPSYFRYYNQENNDVTTAGYFPDNLRLKEGDRIVVIPQDTDAADELYVVTDVTAGTPTVAKATGGSSLPSQTGHSGEFLTTDGTDASWSAVSEVPSTTGATEGDVLTVDSNGDPAWTTPSGGGLPDQTGQSGKFLTTDGTDASWGTINALQNSSTGTDGLSIGSPSSSNYTTTVGLQKYVSPDVVAGTAIGYAGGLNFGSSNGIAIGAYASVGAAYAIQIGGGQGTNSDANTFKVANNNGNFELMNANGNLPADRLASTTGLADGNYRLRLTMSNGTPTLSWVAE